MCKNNKGRGQEQPIDLLLFYFGPFQYIVNWSISYYLSEFCLYTLNTYYGNWPHLLTYCKSTKLQTLSEKIKWKYFTINSVLQTLYLPYSLPHPFFFFAHSFLSQMSTKWQIHTVSVLKYKSTPPTHLQALCLCFTVYYNNLLIFFFFLSFHRQVMFIKMYVGLFTTLIMIPVTSHSFSLK